MDDDRGVREYLEALLPRLGYEVSTSASGETALERLGQANPDLVLVELVLPGIDGLETLKRLQERRNRLPVVFLSGQGRAENIVEAMRQGAADFLLKPFETDEFERTLRNALENKPTTTCPRCHGTGSV